MDQSIRCPRCQEEIQIAAAVAAQIEEQIRQKFENDHKALQQNFAEKEALLLRQQTDLQTNTKTLELDFQKKLAEEQTKLRDQAMLAAKEKVANRIQEMELLLKQSQDKTARMEAEQKQLAEQKRALDADRKTMEETFESRIREERTRIHDQIRLQQEQENSLKLGERDRMIKQLTDQINQLQRKLESSSQILQGEVLELKVEDELRKRFGKDYIEPVPRGEHGGDLIQHVYDEFGRKCGTILWEAKKTRNWSPSWLPKLRTDQREAKADLAVIVTMELPKDVTHFDYIDEVWVTNWACMLSLAGALRSGLISAAQARLASRGRQTDMEKLHDYLTGQEFQHRVKTLVESHHKMKEVLRLEQNYIRRTWAEREKQLQFMLDGAIGMMGDLRGILGNSMPMIDDDLEAGMITQELEAPESHYPQMPQTPAPPVRPSRFREERVHQPAVTPPVSKSGLFGEYGD